MFRLNPKYNGQRGLAGLLMISMAMLFLAASPAAVAQYIGAEACAECHPENYSDWKASGHPYKFMASEEARHRPIPTPAGFHWDDTVPGLDPISWVIGGYKWKSRYLDADGYIITVTEQGDGMNQYNYLTGTWSDYHAGEVMKPYDCGRCHTTGWVADEDALTDNDLSDNQGGLPGIHGTFEFGGVQCEQCHGPGVGSMNVDASAALCGECNIRDDANTIPASGGFIRHHEQYNSFLASPHKSMSCVTCHNPHKPSPFSIKEGRACENCHADEATQYQTTQMFGVGVECIDCHMPYASKSAKALGEFQGDLKTHLFRISTDPAFEMFNEAGTFVNLDGEGQGMVNLDFACKRCHANQTTEWAASYAEGFHSTDFRITAGVSGTWVGPVGERDGEGWLLDMNGLMVGAMYTQDGIGDQAWIIGVGTPAGNMVTLNMIVADGPAFGEMRTIAQVNEEVWGTAKFTFTSCTMATVTLTPNVTMMGRGFVEYTTTISPLLVENAHACPGTG